MTANDEPNQATPQTVEAIMQRGVLGCPPSETLADAAARMVGHGVHALVVEPTGGGPEEPGWAVLAAEDLLSAFGTGQDPETVTVAEVAATEPLTIDASESVSAAARLMSEHQVSHLFVLDPQSRRPTGVISSLDVARAVFRATAGAARPLGLLVGHDLGPAGDDAAALAATLGGSRGSAVVALVIPFPPGTVGAPPLHAREGARTWDEVCTDLMVRGGQMVAERAFPLLPGLDAESRVVLDDSPARALTRLCESDGPDLLVIGSTHRGRVGRLLPGATADRLLNGAPCSVAVAPRGYAEQAPRRPAVIGVGFDGSASARRAVSQAAELARTHDARLRLISVLEPSLIGELEIAAEALDVLAGRGLIDRAGEKLRLAATDLVAAEGLVGRGDVEVVHGDPAEVLLEHCGRSVDLLVVGSRGYGPLRRVLLGSVSTALTRRARCPVVVCTR